MSSAKREENRQVALILTNTLGTSIVYPTGVALADSTPMHVAIVDGTGDQITSFGGGTQYTDAGTPPAHPIGPTLEWSDGVNWQTVSSAKPLPVTATLTSTTITGTVAVTQSTSPWVTSFSAPQHIIADSGTITTVGAVTAITNALPAGSNVIGHVIVDTAPSTAVTNAGTFAVQAAATLAAETTKVIGTVNVASSQTIAVTNTGTFAVQATPVTQADTFMLGAVNVKEINGVAPLMGVGATGTGVQRVVLANDAGKTIVSKGGNAASSGNNTLVTAGTNRLKVKAFSLTTISTTAVTCIFQSGASGTELWRVTLQTPASVAGGANLSVQAPDWLFATAAATLLNLNLSAAVSVDWSISYYDEA